MKRNLPKYCYRKGRSKFVYYIRDGYCKRLPEPDCPTFDGEYRAADADRLFFIHDPDVTKAHGRKLDSSEMDRHFAQIERGAKVRAGKAGREYTLPKHWGADAYIAQKGQCALSGIIMRKGRGRMDPYSPSIDRIDSSKGYIPGNCQLVIHRINLAKGDMDEAEFVRMCRLVVLRSRTASEQTKILETHEGSFETPSDFKGENTP